jgi:hypothetical protein
MVAARCCSWLASLAFGVLAPPLAAQNTHLVTTTAPTGPGSLPAAIAAMQANGQTQILRFQLPPGSTITLTSSLPDLVGSSVEIIGTDTPGLVIDGAGLHGMFSYPIGQSLLVRDVTLRNGRGAPFGGCLVSGASISTQVFDSVFSGCRTDGRPESGSSGGALRAWNALRLTRTRFEGNVAGDGGIEDLSLGGGAVAFTGSSLLIEQSSFIGNYTLRTERPVGGCFDGVGGALSATVSTGGSLLIRDSRFVGNAHRCGSPTGAFSGQGSAISLSGPAPNPVPHFSIESSFFGGNRTSNAAIFVRSVRLSVTNSFFHDNVGRTAGAILVSRSIAPPNETVGELSLVNTTFWQNASETSGADIVLSPGNAVVRQLRNVLFAPTASGNHCVPTSFQADAGAANFVAGNTCVAFLPGGETITLEFAANNTFGLQPPSDRDSLVPILDLAPGSVAIDNGVNASCPARDARNLVRPVDGDGNGSAVCDVGAIEWRLPLLVNGFEP